VPPDGSGEQLGLADVLGEVVAESEIAGEEGAGEDVRAGRRRTAAGSCRVEDDRFDSGSMGWVVTFPGGVWLSEWSHKHPFGSVHGLARRHDRGGQLMPPGRARPGPGDPPGLCAGSRTARATRIVFWFFSGSACCASASRWQARVSSLRATATLAIFVPRRFAIR